MDLVLLGDGLAVERDFLCHFPALEHGLPYDVELQVSNRPDGPVVSALTVRMRTEAVTARGLRAVPVQRLLREAAAGQPVYRVNEDGSAGRLREGNVDVAAYEVAVEREEHLGRRRITNEDLVQVADVYRRARAAGEPPVSAVQEKLRLRSRGQASRWVRAARAAGELRATDGPV